MEYMEVMAYAGLVGAVCARNQPIIDILKTYIDEASVDDIISTFA